MFGAHCGRLWVVEVEEVEGKVQVTLEAKLLNILTWNFDFLKSFLFYFWQELRNPLQFVHCGCYNQKLHINFFVSNRKSDIKILISLASRVTWT